MKISDTEIIMVPGYTNSGENHWQSRWENKFSTARRVAQDDWHKPVVEEWTDNLMAEIEKSSGPTVLIAHSLGCQVVAQTIAKANAAQRKNIIGAFLVAPPDVENPKIRPRHLMTFGPYPRDPLPFKSVVVASTNDSFCEQKIAAEMAKAWEARFVDAGENGHINVDSGHGPWPEGLMVFAEFMKNLDSV